MKVCLGLGSCLKSIKMNITYHAIEYILHVGVDFCLMKIDNVVLVILTAKNIHSSPFRKL